MLTLLSSIDNATWIIALQFVHRFLRNNHRAFLHVGDEPHLAELPGPQNISRIRKRHLVANRARLRIEIAIKRIKFSFLRIDIAVAENQFELERLDVALGVRSDQDGAK